MYRRSKLNNKLFKTMKKILVLFLFSVGCSLYAQQFSADMKKADIMKVCDAVTNGRSIIKKR